MIMYIVSKGQLQNVVAGIAAVSIICEGVASVDSRVGPEFVVALVQNEESTADIQISGFPFNPSRRDGDSTADELPVVEVQNGMGAVDELTVVERQDGMGAVDEFLVDTPLAQAAVETEQSAVVEEPLSADTSQTTNHEAPQQPQKDTKDSITCCICFDDVDVSKKDTGGLVDVECPGHHMFCRGCIQPWLAKGKFSCPVCRASIVKCALYQNAIGYSDAWEEATIDEKCDLKFFLTILSRAETRIEDEESWVALVQGKNWAVASFCASDNLLEDEGFMKKLHELRVKEACVALEQGDWRTADSVARFHQNCSPQELDHEIQERIRKVKEAAAWVALGFSPLEKEKLKEKIREELKAEQKADLKDHFLRMQDSAKYTGLQKIAFQEVAEEMFREHVREKTLAGIDAGCAYKSFVRRIQRITGIIISCAPPRLCSAEVRETALDMMHDVAEKMFREELEQVLEVAMANVAMADEATGRLIVERSTMRYVEKVLTEGHHSFRGRASVSTLNNMETKMFEPFFYVGCAYWTLGREQTPVDTAYQYEEEDWVIHFKERLGDCSLTIAGNVFTSYGNRAVEKAWPIWKDCWLESFNKAQDTLRKVLMRARERTEWRDTYRKILDFFDTPQKCEEYYRFQSGVEPTLID